MSEMETVVAGEEKERQETKPQGEEPTKVAEPQDRTDEAGAEHEAEFEINFDDDPEMALLSKLSPEERERYLKFKYMSDQGTQQQAKPEKPVDRVAALESEIKKIEEELQAAQAEGTEEAQQKAAQLFTQYLSKRDELTAARIKRELMPQINQTRAIVEEVPKAVSVGKKMVLASNPEAKNYQALLEQQLAEFLRRDPSIASDPDKLNMIANIADAMALKQWYVSGRKRPGAQPAMAAAGAADAGKKEDLAAKAKEAGFDNVEDYKHYLETGEFRI